MRSTLQSIGQKPEPLPIPPVHEAPEKIQEPPALIPELPVRDPDENPPQTL